MASLTMMSIFLAGAAGPAASQRPSSTIGSRQRSLIVAKAGAGSQCQEAAGSRSGDKKENGGRRAAIFAAAAAVICAAATGDKMIAMAAEDAPKRGTPEARKAYAPVCVTMPTARICHKIA